MEGITGIMIYYYFVCKRKLWYFMNNINMEQNSELVEIGKLIDEKHYAKEKKGILIDGTINIDFINQGAVIHEVKKSKSIEEASIWQIKYYIYYLQKKGVRDIKAEIDFPLLKEKKEIIVSNKDVAKLDEVIKDIEENISNGNIPAKINEKSCRRCAYFDLCYV